MAAPVGIIGGTGLYDLLPDPEQIELDTPFGAPSAPMTRARVEGRDLVFLARHGQHHEWAPHRVPYRANLWALREVGVRQVLAPCAVGSLRPDLGPGDLVIPDQVIDRTTRRPTTIWDDLAVHVPFADPYCPRGRTVAVERARAAGWPVADGGTLAVIEGPRFSSRSESRALRDAGADIVNMTGMPEAALARELALCYTPLAIVTDRDAGTSAADAVNMKQVLTTFADSIERLRTLLIDIAARITHDRACPCPAALAGTPAEETSGH